MYVDLDLCWSFVYNVYYCVSSCNKYILQLTEILFCLVFPDKGSLTTNTHMHRGVGLGTCLFVEC